MLTALDLTSAYRDFQKTTEPPAYKQGTVGRSGNIRKHESDRNPAHVSTGDDPIVFEVAPPTTVEAAKWKPLF